MLDRLTRMFQSQNPKRNAELVFSRIFTKHSFDAMPYREGLVETRRKATSSANAVGVYITERSLIKGNAPDFENSIPAVTVDFRKMGVGVMLRTPLEGYRVIVSIPDKEDAWKFFECEVRHQSRRPGGWYLVGLQLTSIYEIPDPEALAIRRYLDSVAEPRREQNLEPQPY